MALIDLTPEQRDTFIMKASENSSVASMNELYEDVDGAFMRANNTKFTVMNALFARSKGLTNLAEVFEHFASLSKE
jgi:hypothetical protein